MSSALAQNVNVNLEVQTKELCFLEHNRHEHYPWSFWTTKQTEEVSVVQQSLYTFGIRILNIRQLKILKNKTNLMNNQLNAQEHITTDAKYVYLRRNNGNSIKAIRSSFTTITPYITLKNGWRFPGNCLGIKLIDGLWFPCCSCLLMYYIVKFCIIHGNLPRMLHCLIGWLTQHLTKVPTHRLWNFHNECICTKNTLLVAWRFSTPLHLSERQIL